MTKNKVKKFGECGVLDKTDFYRKVYNYLIEKKLGFCFLENGQLISREDCKAIIGKIN